MVEEITLKVAELRGLGLSVRGIHLSRETFSLLGGSPLLRGKTLLGIPFRIRGSKPFRVLVWGGSKAEETARWCKSVGIRYNNQPFRVVDISAAPCWRMGEW